MSVCSICNQLVTQVKPIENELRNILENLDIQLIMAVCSICNQLVTQVKPIDNELGNILKNLDIQLNNNADDANGEALPTQWICNKCDADVRNRHLLKIHEESQKQMLQMQLEKEKLRNMISQNIIINPISLDREVKDFMNLEYTKNAANEKVALLSQGLSEEQKLNEIILPVNSLPLLTDEKPAENTTEFKTEPDDNLTLLNELEFLDASNQNGPAVVSHSGHHLNNENLIPRLSLHQHNESFVQSEQQAYSEATYSENYSQISQAKTKQALCNEESADHECNNLDSAEEHTNQNEEHEHDAENDSQILPAKTQKNFCKEQLKAVPMHDCDNLESAERTNQNEFPEYEANGTNQMPYKKINDLYTCMLCLTLSDQQQQHSSKCQNAIIQHINKYHFTEYKCNKCGRFFENKSLLHRHYRQKTDCVRQPLYKMPYKKLNNKYICLLCKRQQTKFQTPNQHSMIGHINKQHYAKYKCKYCSKVFTTKSNLQIHYQRKVSCAAASQTEKQHTVSKKFICLLCRPLDGEQPYIAKSKLQLLRHKNKFHYAKHKCTDCDRLFATKHSLRRHKKQKVSCTNANYPPNKRYKVTNETESNADDNQKGCAEITLTCICQQDGFCCTAATLTADHMDNKLKADNLSYVDNTVHFNLQENKKTDNVAAISITRKPRFYNFPYKKVNNLFVCLFCRPSENPYSNEQQAALSRHINEVHYGWKFKCTDCDKLFLTNYSLKRHRSVTCGGLTKTDDNSNTDQNNKKIQIDRTTTDAVTSSIIAYNIFSVDSNVVNFIYNADKGNTKMQTNCANTAAVTSLTVNQIPSNEPSSDNLVSEAIDKISYHKQIENETESLTGTTSKHYKKVAELFICTLCRDDKPFSAKYSEAVTRHANKVHYAKYQCYRCDRVFVSQYSLTRHKHKSACDKPFSAKYSEAVTRHTNKVHYAKYQCDRCDRVFVSQYCLTRHKHKSACDKPFSAKYSEAVTRRANKVQCDRCDRVFASQYSLTRHKQHKSACDTAQFNADMASKQLQSLSSLGGKKNHMVIEPPIAQSLHIKAVHDKPIKSYEKIDDLFVCMLCPPEVGKRFSSKYQQALTHHINRVHYTIYKCGYCDKVFISKLGWTRHCQQKCSSKNSAQSDAGIVSNEIQDSAVVLPSEHQTFNKESIAESDKDTAITADNLNFIDSMMIIKEEEKQFTEYCYKQSNEGHALLIQQSINPAAVQTNEFSIFNSGSIKDQISNFSNQHFKQNSSSSELDVDQLIEDVRTIKEVTKEKEELCSNINVEQLTEDISARKEVIEEEEFCSNIESEIFATNTETVYGNKLPPGQEQNPVGVAESKMVAAGNEFTIIKDTAEKNFLIDSSQNQNNSTTSTKSNHKCQDCDRVFGKKYNLQRHQKTCKPDKTYLPPSWVQENQNLDSFAKTIINSMPLSLSDCRNTDGLDIADKQNFDGGGVAEPATLKAENDDDEINEFISEPVQQQQLDSNIVPSSFSASKNTERLSEEDQQNFEGGTAELETLKTENDDNEIYEFISETIGDAEVLESAAAEFIKIEKFTP